MKCAENAEHLAAYLHDELSCSDEDSFQLHLSVCPACREKHASAREIVLRLQRVVPLEPSAAGRENLRQAIDAALKKPDYYGPPSRFRDGSEVRWRRPNAPRPLALPLRKPPALPAPAAPESNAAQPAASGIVPLSPSAREVSTRLNNITRRRNRKRVRRGYLYALGFTGLLAAAWLVWLGRISPHTAVALPGISHDEVLARARWQERHLAEKQGNERLLVRQQVNLAGIIGEAPVHVLPHSDPRFHEYCLVLFRDGDRKTIADDEHRDVSKFDEVLTHSDNVVPVNGNVALRQQWIDACIGQSSRLIILKLDDHLEIWSASRLLNYLRAGFVFDNAVPAPLQSASALAYYK